MSESVRKRSTIWLTVALVAPHFIDWTQYRPALEAQASRQLGLPVRVSGPIDVRLLPSPSLVLNQIEIGSDTRQSLRARALGIELALGSLMRGQVRASELRLVGPDVDLSLGKDGRLNFPNPTVGFNLNDVSIGKLHVEDARLSFVDDASGKRAVLDKLWFAGDVRSLGAGTVRGEGAFVLNGGLHGYRISSSRSDEGDARIKASVEPADIPLLAESEGLLSFQDGVPRFEGGLTLTRSAVAALAGGHATMSEPLRFTSRVKVTPASALFEQLELQYGPDERAIKATGTAEMTFGENPHAAVVVSARQIDVDRLLASQDQPRRDPVSAIRTLAAAMPDLSRSSWPMQIGFSIDGVTLAGAAVQSLRGDIEVGAKGFALKDVEFRAPGFTHVQMGGQLDIGGDTPSFSGPVQVSAVDARAFVAWLENKNDTPAGGSSPFRGRGELTIDGGQFAIERLVFEVDGKPITGRLAYLHATGDRKARVDAEMKAAEADIDALIALTGAVFKDVKVERPGEMSLALDMERARFAGLDARRAHVKASYDSSGLKIERLNIGDFGGARIDAKGVIDMASASPRGTMTVNVDARDLSGVTALVAKFAPQSLELTRGIAERAGSAGLRATQDVGASPDGKAGESQARFDIGGTLGAVRIHLKGHATGSIADAAKTNLQVDGELASDDAAVLARLIGADRFITAGKTAGRVTVSMSGPLDGDLRIDSRAAAANLDAHINGRLRLFSDQGVAGDFDLAIAKADAGALLRLRQSLPAMLSARTVLSGSSLQLKQMSAELAGVPLRGWLGLTFGSVVQTEGDIETDAVDGTALLAAATGLSTAAPLSSEEPFERGLFSPASGKVSFRARSVGLAGNLAMRNVKGALRLEPSGLGVDIEDAEFAKGRLSGEWSAQKTPDATVAKMRFAIKSADAGLLVPGPSRPRVSGRIDLNAELDGVGRSPKALIGSLSGTGTLTLTDARIEGLDPRAFAVAVRAVDQGLPLDGIRVRDIVLPALDNGALLVRTAETPFTVSAGQLRFGTLLAQADGADVAMSGALNLTERTLDARILLTDKIAETSVGRPEVSMQLRGPIASPARTIDVAALTGWLALRAVEQQSKKLEAIERANVAPITSSVPQPSLSPPVAQPERAPVLPRTRPAAELRAAPESRAAPLPPPVDIKPAPGATSVQREPRSQSGPSPQILTPLPRGSSF